MTALRAYSRRAKTVAAGLLIVGFLSGALAFAATDGNEGATRVDLAPRTAETEDGSFHGDLRLSLAPLLQHAVNLRAVLRHLAAAGSAGAPSTDALREWAEDFATARDLVARLIPRPGRETIRDVTATGAILYRESALVGARAGINGNASQPTAGAA